MSYENAVPKPLKFLISDGKMIDDQGNVIAESETLKDLYTKWNPEVKKYLLSDGSVVDEEGNLIVKNDYYKKIYDQADPKVAKYLHSDGTVDENPGGGSGSTMFYAWKTGNDYIVYTNVDTAPSTSEGMKGFDYEADGAMLIVDFVEEGSIYTKISDTEFTIAEDVGGPQTHYTRDSIKDIEVWNAPPSVETTKQATIDVSTYDPSNKPVIVPSSGKQSMGEVEVTLNNIPSGGSDTPYFIQCSDSSGYNIPILIVPDITKLSVFIATIDTGIAVLSSDKNRVGWHSSSDFDFESENVGDNGISFAGYNVYGIYTYNFENYPSSLKYDGHLYNFPTDLNHVTKNPCIPVDTQALTPTSDIPSGTVTSGTAIHLSTTEVGGAIYYCIEGETNMLEYDDTYPIEITGTCTVRAVTVVNGKAVSEELVLNFEVE